MSVKRGQQLEKGFTIVELAVVIVVLAILVTITVIAIGPWRKDTMATAIQNDLKAAATTIQGRLNSDSTYTYDALPSDVKPTSGVTLRLYATSDNKAFCVLGTADRYSTLRYTYVSEEKTVRANADCPGGYGARGNAVSTP